MKILVTGAKGLLGYWLAQLAFAGFELTLWDIEEFDIRNREAMSRSLAQLRPGVVINTAAYNLVEQCEVERELSWAVNATGPEKLAALCAETGVRLVHFSSDYVFDGKKSAPYVESDPPNPLNHYGAGKLYGERAVLSASPKNLVLRTSWLFGFHPTQSKSYVHSVLRQAEKGLPLKATTDQIAAPTYAVDLARWTLQLIQQGAMGLFHTVNDEGVSRYDWTLAIGQAAVRAGQLRHQPTVEAVPTSYFKSTMPRPGFSVLDNRKAARHLGDTLGSWRQGLDAMLRMHS